MALWILRTRYDALARLPCRLHDGAPSPRQRQTMRGCLLLPRWHERRYLTWWKRIPMHDSQLMVLGRLMDVAALDSRVHAANVANQNTPGYRAKAVLFRDAFEKALTEGSVDEAMAVVPQVVEPRSSAVSADGNDVDMDREALLIADNPYSELIAMARGRLRLLTAAISSAP